MKEYKIQILYTEDKGRRSYKTTVNGKEGKLPLRLKTWIAEDVLREAGVTLRQLGIIFGVSGERIRQLLKF